MNENIILNIDNFVTIKDNNVVIPVEIYNFIKLEIETYKNIIKYLNQEIVNKVELNLENKNVNNEELELMEEKLKYFYKNEPKTLSHEMSSFKAKAKILKAIISLKKQNLDISVSNINSITQCVNSTIKKYINLFDNINLNNEFTIK